MTKVDCDTSGEIKIHSMGSQTTSHEVSPPTDSSRRKRRHPQAVSTLQRLKRFHTADAEENDGGYGEEEENLQASNKTVEADDTPPYCTTDPRIGSSLILSLLPSFLASGCNGAVPLGSTSSRESSPFSHSATSPSSSSANTSGQASTSSTGTGVAFNQYTASAGLCNLLALTQKIEANILSETPKSKNSPEEPEKTAESNLNFSIDNILGGKSQSTDRTLENAYSNASCSFSSILTEAASSQPLYTDSTNNETVDCLKKLSPSLLPSESGCTVNRFPAWIFCTRYSDRPSSGSRTRKLKQKRRDTTPNQASHVSPDSQHTAYIGAGGGVVNGDEEKRPRTAFTAEQLARLKQQFADGRYLTEKRRQELAHELGLNESQIKIWFQNKRAKLKKSGHVGLVSGGPLAGKVNALDSVLPPLTGGAAFAAMQMINARRDVFAESSTGL